MYFEIINTRLLDRPLLKKSKLYKKSDILKFLKNEIIISISKHLRHAISTRQTYPLKNVRMYKPGLDYMSIKSICVD